LGYTNKSWDCVNDSHESQVRKGITKHVVQTSSVVDACDSPITAKSWDDLNPAEKGAAKQLGIDQDVWEGHKDADVEDLDWKDLNPAQQQSLTTLGFNQKSWDCMADAHADASKKVAATKAAAAAKKSHVWGADATVWDTNMILACDAPISNKNWDDLSGGEKDAAAKLGFNKQSWEGQTPIATDDLTWNELSDAQRSAATQLGFNKKNWDCMEDAHESQVKKGLSKHTIHKWSTTETVWDKSILMGCDAPIGAKSWDDLSTKERSAAQQLGFDKKSWEGEVPIAVDDLDWDDLTLAQQASATQLGYSQKSWDCVVDAHDHQVQSGASKHVTHNWSKTETVWDKTLISACDAPISNKSWDDLNSSEKAAAKQLGFDKNSWEGETPIAMDDLEWKDLNAQQKASATALGYNKKTWDCVADAHEANVRAGKSVHKTHKWGLNSTVWDKSMLMSCDAPVANKTWKELNANEQKAAQQLGFDKNSWEGEVAIAIDDLNWDELSAKQQASATALGYTQKNWDCVENAHEAQVTAGISKHTVHKFSSSSKVWNTSQLLECDAPIGTKSWSDLSTKEQAAAKQLGFDAKSWEGETPVAVDDISWNDLTKAQQVSASALGYNKKTWDCVTEAHESQVKAGKSTHSIHKFHSSATVWDKSTLFACDGAVSLKSWDDLNGAEKMAAKDLGFDKDSWEGLKPAAIDELNWDELSSAQRASAKGLGYDAKSWDCVQNAHEVAVQKGASKHAFHRFSEKMSVWDERKLQACEAPIGTKGWKRLNPAEKAAAIQLGFNEKSWEGEETTNLGDLEWKDLTDKQRGAATRLGFNKQSWNCVEDAHEANVKAGRSKHTTHKFSNTMTVWDRTMLLECDAPVGAKAWNELNDKEKSAAQKLGFNQKSWEGETPAAIDDLYWSELSAQQRQEATALGYNKQSWDCAADAHEANVKLGVSKHSVHKFGHSMTVWDKTLLSSCDAPVGAKTWTELSSKEQAAAKALGFTQKSWEGEEAAAIDDLTWSDLSDKQQAQAITLGYNKKSWDCVEGAHEAQVKSGASKHSIHKFSHKMTVWDTQVLSQCSAPVGVKSWGDLDSKEKAAAKALGFTQESWEGEELATIDDLSWKDLSAKQQQSASALGYDKKSWDCVNDSHEVQVSRGISKHAPKPVVHKPAPAKVSPKKHTPVAAKPAAHNKPAAHKPEAKHHQAPAKPHHQHSEPAHHHHKEHYVLPPTKSHHQSHSSYVPPTHHHHTPDYHLPVQSVIRHHAAIPAVSPAMQPTGYHLKAPANAVSCEQGNRALCGTLSGYYGNAKKHFVETEQKMSQARQNLSSEASFLTKAGCGQYSIPNRYQSGVV
jgi:hypothetical protein